MPTIILQKSVPFPTTNKLCGVEVEDQANFLPRFGHPPHPAYNRHSQSHLGHPSHAPVTHSSPASPCSRPPSAGSRAAGAAVARRRPSPLSSARRPTRPPWRNTCSTPAPLLAPCDLGAWNVLMGGGCLWRTPPPPTNLRTCGATKNVKSFPLVLYPKKY